MIIIISNLSDLIYTIIQFEGILNGEALLHPLYGRHRSKMDGALTGSQSKELMFISSGWGGSVENFRKFRELKQPRCSTRVLNRSPPTWTAMFGFGNAYVPSDSLRNLENVNFARDSAPIVTRTTTSCFSHWLSPYAAACEEVYENCELRISSFLLLFVHKTGV